MFRILSIGQVNGQRKTGIAETVTTQVTKKMNSHLKNKGDSKLLPRTVHHLVILMLKIIKF